MAHETNSSGSFNRATVIHPPIDVDCSLWGETSTANAAAVAGEVRGKVGVLLRLGHKRFGPPDPATESALNAISDLGRLERLADAILTARSWHEFLATP